MSLKVVLANAASTSTSLRFAGGRADRGTGIDAAAREIRARDRLVALEQPLQVARVDDLAAVLPRRRADVDDVVGLDHRGLVVLDDDQRVAEVAQPHERVEQPPVVALVQPDRRLVEDVQHADEPAADLRREPDALGLPAGERARGASQA